MADAMTMQGWVRQVDQKVSQELGVSFPPKGSMPMQKAIQASYKSFARLQVLRGSVAHRGDNALPCAEHYAYARFVVCTGGALVFPMIVTASLTYYGAKSIAKKAGVLQEFGKAVSAGNGPTTPASGDQLSAAIKGAEAGLALHYNL